MSSIKALLINKTGGPEVIEEGTLPIPELKPGQVLIRVAYAGVNFIDTYFRSGLYPVQFPFVLGQEAAGEIVDIALSTDSSTSSVKKGDKVAAYISGSYAEYAVAEIGKVFVLPEGVSMKDAAGMLVQGLTALTMLRESHPCKKGDWIIVHAAAGGVGLNLIQIASALGIHTIGTTSTLAKAELARAHGASVVVVGGSSSELQAAVDKETDGKGAIAIFDGVGKETFDANWGMLARKGTLVTFGNASGPPPDISPLKLVKGNWKLTRPTLANFITTPEEFQAYCTELFDMFSAGSIKLNIFHIASFSSDGLREAHRLLTGRESTGKLLVEVSRAE